MSGAPERGFGLTLSDEASFDTLEEDTGTPSRGHGLDPACDEAFGRDGSRSVLALV